jgi:hypothetical protein
MLANIQRIIELFTPKKLPSSSQKYRFGIRDQGSGKKHIRDPGSRGQKGTGSRIRDTASFPLCFKASDLLLLVLFFINQFDFF